MVTQTNDNSASMDYSEYVVKSAASERDAAMAGAALGVINHHGIGGGQLAGTIDTALAKSYKQLVPRDRPAPMLNPTKVARCTLCENYANWAPGLGDLFGPYRVSGDYDCDMTDEQLGESRPDFEKGQI